MPKNCLSVFDHFLGLMLKGFGTIKEECKIEQGLEKIKQSTEQGLGDWEQRKQNIHRALPKVVRNRNK